MQICLSVQETLLKSHLPQTHLVLSLKSFDSKTKLIGKTMKLSLVKIAAAVCIQYKIAKEEKACTSDALVQCGQKHDERHAHDLNNMHGSNTKHLVLQNSSY